MVPTGAMKQPGTRAASGEREAHFLRQPPGLSKNWSGYLVAGPSFRHVSARWRVPRVSRCSGRHGYSAMWIGLGGYSGEGLEQVGTEVDCPGGGPPVTFAWYELLPSPVRKVGLRVRPGDRVSGSVTVAGAWTTIRLQDLDRGRSFRRGLYTREVNLSSAEWILEAPSVCVPFTSRCRIRPLLAFGRAAFGAARVTTADALRGAIADRDWRRTRIVLLQQSHLPGGRYVLGAARPSGLRARGSSFAVTYKRETL